jgi:D-glycero-D-manno-heptose 1,7-bisphosphate phosphatase
MNRAIFLDRDGVINYSLVRSNKPYPPRNLSDFELIDGVHHTLQTLSAKGYLLFIFTNQPDVARGTLSLSNLEEIHSYILQTLPITKIYYCAHDDKDNCHCRKPKPGMILEAAKQYDINLFQSYVVGDRWRDIEAGKKAGCKTIFIDYKYAENLLSKPDFTIEHVTKILSIINE